ncbi:MAG TPA: trigger factor [Capsulimonadaceae bacterium]|jgi:trigger factor
MQVVKETLSPCQVSLQISVEPEKVALAVDKAYREFSKYISVPGFRKGHAPLAFVKQRVPQEQLRERTVELLTEPAFREAVEKEEIVPFAAPELSLVSLETVPGELKFEFKALVPLAPVVELGEYKGLTVDRERYEITDEAVSQRIEQIRDRAAEYPVVSDRASQDGDILVTDLGITPEGDSEPASPKPTVIYLGDAGNVPGLDAQLLGLSPGDEKSFRLQYPDDFDNAEIAGKVAGFYVKVNELHTKLVPELDDEFAKKFGDFDTMEAFKASIKSDLEAQMTSMADNLVQTKLVDQVAENSVVNFPDVIVQQEFESEVGELIEDLKRRKLEVEDYLTQIGKTQEEFVSERKAQAEQRVKRGLVLGEIALKEEIKVDDADVDAEVAERAAKNRTSPEAMRAYLDANKQTDGLARGVLTKKILRFLTSAAIITDKVLSTDDEPVAAPKATKKAAAAATKTGEGADEAEKPKRTRKKKQDEPTPSEEPAA